MKEIRTKHGHGCINFYIFEQQLVKSGKKVQAKLENQNFLKQTCVTIKDLKILKRKT
jgi:hypothetical protein